MAMGFCGASSTGKSTLARALIEYCEGMVMVESRGSAIFQALGLPMDRPLSFDERILVQNAILEAHCEDVKKAGNYAISDRTPIDMAAYMLGEWGANCTGGQGKILLKYVDRCFAATNRLFSSVVLIQPGIPYVADPKRPPPNNAAVELFNYLAKSLIADQRLLIPSFKMARSMTDLTQRRDTICNVWNHVVVASSQMRKGEHVH